MIKQITKLTKLHKSELANVKKLVDLCAHQDGFKIKLYWNILQDRQTAEFNDFLFYIDGNLVGYLALFTFKINEAELTAVIHPKYRNQGIFKNLLAEAVLELKKRALAYTLCICNQNSVIAIDYCRRHDGNYLHSQVEMTALKPPVEKTLPAMRMRPASVEDVVLLAKIGSDSFGSPFLDVLQRFIENFRDKSRKVWLVSSDEHENIGKIHVRYEENKTAFIHDLCILPEHRGKHYAMAMILKTMQLLREQNYKLITLDVECHNEGALRLYEQCGFEVTSGYDFWRVAVENLP